MGWQRTRIAIPDDLGPRDRELLASEVLDFIQDRTQSGTGIDLKSRRNRGFPEYTKEYAEQKGVSRGDVDLTLSEDMLNDMKLISHQKGSLLIGFDNGTKSNSKAEGNQLGSYGRAPKRSKARPFLSISRADLNRLVRSGS